MKNIVNYRSSINEALNLMNNEGVASVFVVNDDFKLIGSFTDGDLRRKIVRRQIPRLDLTDIMNPDPISRKFTASRLEVLQVLKQSSVSAIPLVDDENILMGVATNHEVKMINSQPSTVVIMAGGFGKRMYPLTKEIPKPLVRVAGAPMIARVIDHYASYGFVNFVISTFYKAQMIEDFLGDGESRGIKIKYIREEKPLGTAGCLSSICSNAVGPFLVTNGDVLTDFNPLALLDFHERKSSEITICAKPWQTQIPYGEVKQEEGRLKALLEKPTITHQIFTGITVLNSDIVRAVPGGVWLDMPDLITSKMRDTGNVFVFQMEDNWSDVGVESAIVGAESWILKDARN